MAPREYWAAIYKDRFTGYPIVGSKWPTRGGSILADAYFPPRAIFRIHVRLKPPGAPARYSSEHDRRNWEQYPEEMRKCPF